MKVLKSHRIGFSLIIIHFRITQPLENLVVSQESLFKVTYLHEISFFYYQQQFSSYCRVSQPVCNCIQLFFYAWRGCALKSGRLKLRRINPLSDCITRSIVILLGQKLLSTRYFYWHVNPQHRSRGFSIIDRTIRRFLGFMYARCLRKLRLG